MTDLQVVQPVFTLVLHSMFRLRTTTLPAIVGRVDGTFTLVTQHPSDERKNRSKQDIRADESNDAA
jgi:hypothetical protein